LVRIFFKGPITSLFSIVAKGYQPIKNLALKSCVIEFCSAHISEGHSIG